MEHPREDIFCEQMSFDSFLKEERMSQLRISVGREFQIVKGFNFKRALTKAFGVCSGDREESIYQLCCIEEDQYTSLLLH